MKNINSYYDILNVSSHSSDQTIKAAYIKLAKRFHPDQNPQNRSAAEQHFQLISQAYINLKTREKRALYNRTLRQNRHKKIQKQKWPQAQNDNIKSGLFSQIGAIFWPQNKEQQEPQK